MECTTLQATSIQPDLETGYRQGAMFSLEVTNDYSQEVDNSQYHQLKAQEEATQERMDLLVEFSKNRLIKLNKWQKEAHSMETCFSKIRTI